MFTPTPIPYGDLQSLAAAVESNLRALVQELNGQQTEAKLLPLAKAPSKPREGWIVVADGTNWNPGGGAGAYQRLGGAWVKL